MATTAEKLKCVARELRLRLEVYPRRIAAGRMTKDVAAREIKLMGEVVEDYKKLAEQEKLL